jgi:Caspase domain
MSISPCTFVLRARRDENEPSSLVSIIPDNKDNWYVGMIIDSRFLSPRFFILMCFSCNLKSGCHNDVRNIKQYLIDVQGFKESEMLILMDDGRTHPPTRRNIEDAFQRICQYSVAGDIVWVHYSGHGSRVRDVSGDEEDGYDSTLIPVDFRSAGQILDDDGT